MATNFVQEGNALNYTAGADIDSGDFVLIGAIGGVAAEVREGVDREAVPFARGIEQVAADGVVEPLGRQGFRRP